VQGCIWYSKELGTGIKRGINNINQGKGNFSTPYHGESTVIAVQYNTSLEKNVWRKNKSH
jgi:hypothetical protein